MSKNSFSNNKNFFSSLQRESTFQKELSETTNNLEKKLSQDVDTEISSISIMEKLLRDVKS